MRRAAVLAVGLAALIPASAAAQTTVSTPGPWQAWVAAARVPTPPVELEVLLSEEAVELACGMEAPGCAAGNIIAMAPEAVHRELFYHELGHQFDFNVMTDPERERFLALLGPRYADMAWWAGEDHGAGWLQSGGEWFAEAYMQCARLQWINPEWRHYAIAAGRFTGRRLRRECALIRWSAEYAGVS